VESSTELLIKKKKIKKRRGFRAALILTRRFLVLNSIFNEPDMKERKTKQ
jgi:hypothetical protein